MLFAAEGGPALDFTEPAVWVNLGVAGAFLFFFMMGKIHSPREMERVERIHSTAFEEQRKANEAALKVQKESHDSAMQRMDDQVRQLLLERDRALSERDEMIGVIRDFTLMAGAVLEQPFKRPPPKRGERNA